MFFPVILLKHLKFAPFIAAPACSSRFDTGCHTSDPYVNREHTTDLYSRSLRSLMRPEDLVQLTHSRHDHACMSYFSLPFAENIDPRYLNLNTFSNSLRFFPLLLFFFKFFFTHFLCLFCTCKLLLFVWFHLSIHVDMHPQPSHVIERLVTVFVPGPRPIEVIDVVFH